MDIALNIIFDILTNDDEKIKIQFEDFLKAKLTGSGEEFTIKIHNGQVSVVDSKYNKISLNFNSDLEYRRKLKSKSTEIISKAVGSGKKGNHILDLTAGLGIDAISLVQLGYYVVSIERNPLVYLALKSAYDQWTSELKPNLTFIFADVMTVLQSLAQGIYLFADQNLYTVGYYDPMFPQKKKSALPKQEMVLLQKLTNEDPDANQTVLRLAGLKASEKIFKRFVVKRPLNAETIVKPSSQLKGKLIRYDIYD
jgi:16S rRNA (guanine1516-N2)-methyltransferase